MPPREAAGAGRDGHQVDRRWLEEPTQLSRGFETVLRAAGRLEELEGSSGVFDGSGAVSDPSLGLHRIRRSQGGIERSAESCEALLGVGEKAYRLSCTAAKKLHASALENFRRC